jgi:TRAP-type mannitol/chloroaromatic compound transport system permease small subunit
MKKIARVINAANDTMGRFFSLLILPLIFVVMYEVIARKIFHAPTSWGLS